MMMGGGRMYEQRRLPCSFLSSPLLTGGSIEEGFEEDEVKRRRLKTEQVQYLERSFEAEKKLEPERKIKLAKDLGLQPRQVAVWFQNRRVRWKTKQLESDYDILKSHYQNLTADYDNLLKEKDKLKAQVNFLTDKMLSLNEGRKTETKNLEAIDKAAFDSESGSEIRASVKNPPGVFNHGDFGSSGTDCSGVLYEHVNSLEADESDEEEVGISNGRLPQTYPEASPLSCNDMFAMDDHAHIPWWEWP